MRKLFSVLLLVTVVLGLVSCGSSGEFDVDQRSEIIVGLEAAYAPFNWATPTPNNYTVKLDGQSSMYADGFDVVMAKRIADELGLTLIVKALEWDGLIPALLAGEIDVIIAGMSPTEERAQTVSFSEEYYRSEQVIVVNLQGNFSQATSLADFKGARIVAQLGTLQDGLIDQINGVIHQEALNDYATLTQAVKNNASDGFVSELPVAQGIVQSNPQQFTFISFTAGNGFQASDEDVAVSVALRQEDEKLLALINDILAGISTETRNQYMEAALNRQPKA